jgi:hypothetical protein
MAVHHLNSYPEPFKAVAERRKPFEWRKNDRDFQMGDFLVLHEYDPDLGVTGERTGRRIMVFVKYILDGASAPAAFGLPKDYCVMGIEH